MIFFSYELNANFMNIKCSDFKDYSLSFVLMQIQCQPVFSTFYKNYDIYSSSFNVSQFKNFTLNRTS